MAAPHYMGRSCNAIDASNRIMLPSDWRKNGPREFVVSLVLPEKYLTVCSRQAFEERMAGLRAAVTKKEELPPIERAIFNSVRKACLDKVGRLPLPAEFLEAAQIANEAEVVGLELKFEIWSRERYGQVLHRNTTANEAANQFLRSL